MFKVICMGGVDLTIRYHLQEKRRPKEKWKWEDKWRSFRDRGKVAEQLWPPPSFLHNFFLLAPLLYRSPERKVTKSHTFAFPFLLSFSPLSLGSQLSLLHHLLVRVLDQREGALLRLSRSLFLQSGAAYLSSWPPTPRLRTGGHFFLSSKSAEQARVNRSYSLGLLLFCLSLC